MFPSLPPVTLALLIANVAVFLAQGFADDSLVIWFALWPFGSPAYTGPEAKCSTIAKAALRCSGVGYAACQGTSHLSRWGASADRPSVFPAPRQAGRAEIIPAGERR